MENHELASEIQKLSKDMEAQRGVLSHVINLLVNLSGAVDEGFKTVNERLSLLEGKDGMQGVNKQLGDIKFELNKIQKAYNYEDLYTNIQSLKGEA